MYDQVVHFVAAYKKFPSFQPDAADTLESVLALWWRNELQRLSSGTLQEVSHAPLLRVLQDSLIDYSAHVNKTAKFGGLGRVRVLRYNPCVSSSNPAG